MIFYTQETYWALLIAALPIIVSIYCFFALQKEKPALYLLLLGAFLLRLTLIALDPFLQDWDERFHALVAKNMMHAPFYPMLRADSIFSYDYKAWCCNHIWLHKQPLFLWQMALSMKIFGVHEITLRLPSAIMGTLMVFFTFKIGVFWTKNARTAYLAALLMACSFFQLELTSGRFPVEHNDIAFAFYMSASIWAFTKYLHSGLKSIKWAALVGLFVGCAILIKWLTALLIFGGWGLYLMQHRNLRWNFQYYGHLILSVFVACVIFLPWQIYITKTFPLESAWTYAFNRKHIFEALEGHTGNIFFYLKFMQTSYGKYLLPFMILGMGITFFDKKINHRLTISFGAMITVIYGFFSLVVATKMNAFTYPVVTLLWIFVAIGLHKSLSFLKLGNNTTKDYQAKIIHLFLVFFITTYTLKPWNIAQYRSKTNNYRNTKIHNTTIYKSLDEKRLSGNVILNVKQFEDVELMFYKNINAYQWYPKSNELDSLQNLGYKFIAFKNHGKQTLPDYIQKDSTIQQLEMELR